MSVQAYLGQLADAAPPPAQPASPTLPPVESRYTKDNLLYMLAFGMVAWVGGKLAEKTVGPIVESVVETGKGAIGSVKENVSGFFSSDDEEEPSDEEEPEEDETEDEEDVEEE